MNDKEIMEGILLTTKGVCDLYMHGSIESATPNVHEAFNTALNDSLCMQDGIDKQRPAAAGIRPSRRRSSSSSRSNRSTPPWAEKTTGIAIQAIPVDISGIRSRFL